MDLTKEKVQKAIDNLSFPFPYSAEEWMEHMYLENYHCHKDFSNTAVIDCAEKIENYAERILEYGSGKCLYSGEHGSQGNQFHVYKVAEQYGLKYRHSAEVYWVKDRHEKDRANCHMMIVAKNPEGREDLNYILSVANEDGYYGQPRIDLELLLSVKPENFIVTSGCVAGFRYPEADKIWLKIADHFGKNFFFEVQNHNTQKQKDLNTRILKLAKENNIPIICGLDSHYVLEENKLKRELLQMDKGIEYNNDESGWYMDYPDTKTVIQRFEEQGVLNEEQILEAVLNTNVFVNECEEIVLDRHFKIPNIYKDLDYEGRVKFLKTTLSNIYKEEKNKSKEKVEAIRWEVEQYVESGTVDYPLISRAIVQEAVAHCNGVMTSTARGSGSGYVTNQMLGLTTIDRFTSEVPIYPERFLTKERILAGQCPDLDINVAESMSFERAAKNLLGEHGCYPLMAISTYKEKAAWLMYARVSGIEPSKSQIVSKAISEYNKVLLHAEEEEKSEIKIEDYIPEEYLDLFQESKSCQGITVGLIAHPCARLIFDGDIRREVGLISAKSETKKERVLVAAAEGKYLDEFGYVKEDFLIVDSVALTDKLFKSVGQPVPTFEELKRMVKDDKATWDIYAKGITCCINQVEKESTTKKVMRYKPKDISELCAFIAGIRPGFASLIDNFIRRKPYTTGEAKIDELLESSAHYMLYQESIMKVLSFLGLPMGETYSVIKSISKKKLKGQKLEDLLKQLKASWLKEFGNLDNFDKIWNVIKDAARYSFNAAHAYSMAGDSLYLAWFKAHHTAKFYEVAISHYQEKEKKDKIDALVKECMEFYGYRLGAYEFGNDNRRVNLDEENKIIYPNLSSIKGFGEKIVDQLYETGLKQYRSFREVYQAIQETAVNKTQLTNLAKLGYFRKYGNENQILSLISLYNFVSDLKTRVSKTKLQEQGIAPEKVLQFGRETKSMLMDLRKEEMVAFLESEIHEPEPTDYQRLQWQMEVTGMVDKQIVSFPKNEVMVTDIDIRKGITNLKLYSPSRGKGTSVKMYTKGLEAKQFQVGSFIRINQIEKRVKTEFTGNILPNGRREYKPVASGEKESWLKSYTVIGG